MRLRLHFGSSVKREINWYKAITDFPPLIDYNNRKWEFVLYDKGKDGFTDWDCQFSEVHAWDNSYWSENFIMLETVTGEYGFRDRCECGAEHTSFEWDHMKFCPKWKSWSKT